MSIGKVIETLETEIREYKRMIDARTLCLAGESAYGECQSRIDFDREIISLLRTHPDAQPNEPLTLDELRGMVRQPIWMECKHFSGWAILHLAWPEIYVSAADGNTYFIWANGEYNERLGAKLYRRPPKEEHHEETP